MPKYIYICSAGHSGSTLLDLLLGSHSCVASLGEIHQLTKSLALNTICSCGSPVRSCPLWNAVVHRVGNELGIDIFSNPYALNLGYPRSVTLVDPRFQTPWYLTRRTLVLGLTYLHHRSPCDWLPPQPPSVAHGLDNNVRIFEAVRATLDLDMIVDSSKSYLKGVSLYRRYPDSVRILLLTRDGRGVYASNLKRGRSRVQSVRSWRNVYERALPLLQGRVKSAHWQIVRYEDLTVSPAETLRGICKFLGLSFEERMLDFRWKPHHVTDGNDMRLAASAEITRDESWRTTLSPGDLAYFDRKAGWLNRRLGYE